MARQRIGEGELFAGPLYRLARRHISWFVMDLIICMLAVTLTASTWRLFEIINWGLWPLSVLAFILAVLFSIMNVFLGLDRVVWSRAGAEDALVLASSNGMSLLLLLSANYLQERSTWFSLPALPTELIVSIGVLTLVGCLFARYRMRLVTYEQVEWVAQAIKETLKD